jgi:hypothetical protein
MAEVTNQNLKRESHELLLSSQHQLNITEEMKKLLDAT